MAVPYTFGTATASIPLSQLDSNFATVITLGNTAIQLGNTVTTLNNMTLANVTISSGNITLTNVSATTANVTTANITTAVIGTETVTTSTITSANITTANVTTANITTGNVTTGTVSTSLTLSYGTANAVAYLNGSKVVTTGSALTFDGTNFATTGTATAAKLIPTGSSATGNGLYLPAANALGLSTNGTNAVYIDASQNVGIGTTTPTNRLNVVASDSTNIVGASTAGITITNTYTGAFGYSSDLIYGVGGGAGSKLAGISGIYTNNSSSTGGALVFYTNTGSSTFTEKMRITSTGEVGIGTNSPGVKLDVSGVIRSTGTGAILAFSKRSTGTGDAWGMYSQSGEYNIYDYTAGVSRLVIDTSGTVLVGITSATASSLIQLSNGIASTAGASNKISLYYASAASAFGLGIASGQFTYNSGDGAHVFYTGGNTSPVERMRIDSSGNVLVTNPAGLGYGTGSGGTVTQATSRTTGVTLSKPTGAITMFSAAGSVVAATFTVTNTLVAATDTIILNQKSGTNLYVLLVTAVAAGSFNITFYTTGGVATDAPVINFAIIKGATA